MTRQDRQNRAIVIENLISTAIAMAIAGDRDGMHLLLETAETRAADLGTALDSKFAEGNQ